MNFARLVPELIVSDISRSVEFYTRVLGLDVMFDRPEERFAYLDRQGAQLMLEQPTDRAFLLDDLHFPYGRGVNLQIDVDDLDALYESVVEAEGRVMLPLEEKSYRVGDDMFGQRQFVVVDPDGYLLRFCQPVSAHGGASQS